MRRSFVSALIAVALLLLGWAVGQRSPAEDETSKKVQALEERIAQLEQKVSHLEKRLATLERRVPRLPVIVPAPVPYTPPMFPEQLLPRERSGFGLPRPAPNPFVQPYYYPLEH